MDARDPQHACKFADALAKELGYVKYRHVFSMNWPLEQLARKLKGVDRKGVEACNMQGNAVTSWDGYLHWLRDWEDQHFGLGGRFMQAHQHVGGADGPENLHMLAEWAHYLAHCILARLADNGALMGIAGFTDDYNDAAGAGLLHGNFPAIHIVLAASDVDVDAFVKAMAMAISRGRSAQQAGKS